MKIKFQQYSETEQALLKPQAAIKNLPEWYKKMPPFTSGDRPKFFGNGTKNLTIKRCNPVGDALGAGYFLVLENSISVQPQESGIPEIIWHRGGEQFISQHGQEQIDKQLIPNGFTPQPFKFKNDWSIQTPKGYSVLVTHPLNRNAEPFFTLSGLVETDTYHQAIQLPFLIRQDFQGLIESGTPIAQVIPFRREKWSSHFLKHSEDFYKEKSAEFARTMNRYYHRFHWKRKEWK